MDAKTLLNRMPEALKAEAVVNTNVVIQYDISEPVYQVVDNGSMTVHEGQAENPNLTIKMSDEDLVALFSGTLNPMMAFMNGRIKLQGDMMLAQKLVGFIDQDKISKLA